jgi:perosamine synthetase
VSVASRIPLSVPALGADEARNLEACIAENWVAARGRFVAEFEQAFAAYHDADDAVSTVNGTAALHLALVELGIGPGDEVIVPALTFVAPANAVRYVGANPVFADVDPETYGIDAASVASCIGPTTKAIIVVHLYGHPVDMDPIRELAREHRISVIEDATEALGSRCRGALCGTLGDIGCFSFNGNKVITSGGGGMLLARDPKRLGHLRHLSLQAPESGREYVHDEVGYNYALSNLHAAVGLAQFHRLDQMLVRRRRIAERYAEGLSDVEGLRFCGEAPWATSNFWLMSVLIDPDVFGESRMKVMDRLDDGGVDSRPFFSPISSLPPYREFRHAGLSVSERLHADGLCIPSSSTLDEADQDRVIDLLRRR